MSMTVQSISARQLADWLADGQRTPPLLLDVREPREVETAHVEQARCIPMHQVPHQCESFDPESDIVVMCHHGARSMQVAIQQYSWKFRLKICQLINTSARPGRHRATRRRCHRSG